MEPMHLLMRLVFGFIFLGFCATHLDNTYDVLFDVEGYEDIRLSKRMTSDRHQWPGSTTRASFERIIPFGASEITMPSYSGERSSLNRRSICRTLLSISLLFLFVASLRMNYLVVTDLLGFTKLSRRNLMLFLGYSMSTLWLIICRIRHEEYWKHLNFHLLKYCDLSSPWMQTAMSQPSSSSSSISSWSSFMEDEQPEYAGLNDLKVKEGLDGSLKPRKINAVGQRGAKRRRGRGRRRRMIKMIRMILQSLVKYIIWSFGNAVILMLSSIEVLDWSNCSSKDAEKPQRLGMMLLKTLMLFFTFPLMLWLPSYLGSMIFYFLVNILGWTCFHANYKTHLIHLTMALVMYDSLRQR